MVSVDNHLGLPEEVFEIIVLNLALGDVLSCSLVCLGWRNAINSNRIWEKLCKKNISEERLKLRAERKIVGSSYEVLESENLPRLCVWRRRYRDDVDLKRNWKRGCCQEDFITSCFLSISSPFYRMEADNELLLVPKGDSHFTVFSIVDKPIRTGEIHLPLWNVPFVKLSNNILVIVQSILLQVYVKDEDKNLKLKFLALYDRNHSETTDTQNLTNWYNQIRFPRNLNIMCDHNGKHFVAMTSRYDAGVFWCSPLHIWDLEFQTKVQEVALPRQAPGDRLKRASFFLRYNTVHIILKYLSSTLIYAYDVEKSSYSETVLQLEGDLVSVLLTGTVAIMESVVERKLRLFDLRDGRMLDTLTNGQSIVDRSVQAFGNLITYAEHAFAGNLPTVAVYDTGKLRLVDKFEVERRYGIVTRIHIVMDNLVLVCTVRHLLIRDAKKREILRTVDCFGFIPPHPSCSKMVVRKQGNELVLLHFW